MSKYRIACFYDTHADGPQGRVGWAYWRRCCAIQRWAPADFAVDIFQFTEVPWGRLDEYDLIYNAEFASPSRERIPADVPLVVSFNADSNRRREWWGPVTQQATYTVCNNLDVFLAHKRQARTCCIANGVDSQLFNASVPIASRPHTLLWTGSTNPKKGKFYTEVIDPLSKRLAGSGFECSFRPVNQIDPAVVFNTEQQAAWYNSGSYVLCASLSEGTPGIITEGVACGCVAVSVPVGNILEWKRDRHNCVLVERNVDSFLRGLEYAREHRERLSAAGAALMRNQFSYGPPGNRALWFFQLFRRLIEDGPDSIKPFAYNEKHWSEI